MSRLVPVTKNGYVDLLQDIMSDLQAVRRNSETTTEKLAELKPKLRALDLRVELFSEDDGVLTIYINV